VHLNNVLATFSSVQFYRPASLA